MITQLVPHTDPVDGVHRASLDLTTELACLGVSSLVLTLSHGKSKHDWERVATVLDAMSFLDCSPRRAVKLARVVRMASGLPARAEVVVAHRIDLVNAAALIRARQRAPLVFHAHNGPPPWLKWNDALRVFGSRSIKKVIVASRYMRQAWEELVHGRVSIDVVEYPIACDFFDIPSAAARDSARRSFGIPAGTVVLGYFGRLEHEKGVHVLAAAAADLAGEHRIHVLVQGQSNHGVPLTDAARYRALCDAAFGRATRTWLHPHPDVRPLIAASHVVMVPSVWAEPSGLAVSEALATGTPVVGSRTGGIPEQVPDSPLVALAEPGSPNSLAEAIRHVLSTTPNEQQRVGLRSHVVNRRSRRLSGQKYLAALEIAASHGPC